MSEGISSCRHCGLSFAEPMQGGDCPACGRNLARPPETWETGLAPIKRYFLDLWQIMSRPSTFFRRMPLQGGVAGPLAFALITQWIGSATEYLWQSAIGGALGRMASDFFKVASDIADVDHPGRSELAAQFRDRLLHWTFGAGAVLIDPFKTLVKILFTSVLMFAAARLLVTPNRNGAPSEITFETSLRIVCFSMSPAILAGVPMAGSLIAWIGVVLVTVVGVREVYRIDTGRAAAIALFPRLIFPLLAAFGLLFLLVLVVKMFAEATT